MSGIDAYKKALNQTASSGMRNTGCLRKSPALIDAQETAGDMKKSPAKMQKIAEALNWNNEVWSAFMEDCRSENNKLPDKLRGGILSLGLWVGKETQAAMNGDVSLDALISVNRDIMKGLDDATTIKTDPDK